MNSNDIKVGQSYFFLDPYMRGSRNEPFRDSPVLSTKGVWNLCLQDVRAAQSLKHIFSTSQVDSSRSAPTHTKDEQVARCFQDLSLETC